MRDVLFLKPEIYTDLRLRVDLQSIFALILVNECL